MSNTENSDRSSGVSDLIRLSVPKILLVNFSGPYSFEEAELNTCGKDILLRKIKDKRMCCLKNGFNISKYAFTIDISITTILI